MSAAKSPTTKAPARPGWGARLAQAIRSLFSRQAQGEAEPLASPRPSSGAAMAEPAEPADERARWKSACMALTNVLNKHPSSRSVFRQLTMLENTLLDRGPRVIDKLPLELLEGSLEQLETLVTDWSARDLAFLRSRLSVTVTTRQKRERTAAQELSQLVTPERLQVREASDSVFLEFQQHFTASKAGDALRV